MSLINDIRFLKRLNLSGLREINNNKFIFRCPICGDSKISEKKARGFSERHKKIDGLFIYCHNCNYAKGFGYFLKDLFDINFITKSFLDDYNKLKFKKEKGSEFTITEKDYYNFSKNKNHELENGIIKNVNTLKNDHVFEYLRKRHIKKDFFKDIFITYNFKKLINDCYIKGKYKSERDHCRLVFPIYDDNELIGLQGRLINNINLFKYLTIKLKEESTLCYIPDHIDLKKTVYLTEGIFDALMLENGCAMLKSMIDIEFVKNKFQKVVFIFDNEKRNKAILRNYEKISNLKDCGLFIWPKYIKVKDLNELGDMIDLKEINHLVEKNSYFNVLEKKLKLSEWRIK